MSYQISYNFPDTERPQHFVYQIYYDEKTKAELDAGFIPLDNTENRRPDWYEFWVILNFLRKETLRDDAWYGFFSPRFYLKTGLRSHDVLSVLGSLDSSYDVANFSIGVDQIIFYRNVFEQGEFWHPGLIAATSQFLSTLHQYADLQLDSTVSHSRNACFSNFLIAKPLYWKKWKEIAEAFFEYAENSNNRSVARVIEYGAENAAPMKTFIQERISSLVLLTEKLKVYALPLDFSLRSYPTGLREVLIAADVLKRKYCDEKDDLFLRAYDQLRCTLEYDKSTLMLKSVQ